MLEKPFLGVQDLPELTMAAGFSLDQIAGMVPDLFSPEKVKEVLEDLAKNLRGGPNPPQPSLPDAGREGGPGATMQGLLSDGEFLVRTVFLIIQRCLPSNTGS